jgi:hypothetical protein
MKKLLVFLFVLGLAVQSFGQLYRLNAKADGTIGEYHTMVDDGTNGDTSSGDGIYSFALTITDPQLFGQWLVNINGVDTPNSWYVTTSTGQTVLFTLNTNTLNDGWFPNTNIINANDQLSTGHSIKIIIDGGATQTMVDDGLTNGDWAVDNIYAYHAVVATTGSHTWNAECSARGNFHWTANNNGRVNSWSDVTSFNTTSDNQDVYFYLNLNTGRLTTTLNSPVPVELTSFTAKAVNASILLNWETATEVNNYGFDIEASEDNENWNTIGFVEGHGNSNSPNSYNFIVNTSVAERSRSYRLKQLDIDGGFKYSDVVEVKTNLRYKLLQNHPNPFNPTTTVSFSLPNATRANISIYNTLGQKVMEVANQEFDAGNHTIEINASQLSSGIYFYKLETLNFSKTMKMMLLK